MIDSFVRSVPCGASDRATAFHDVVDAYRPSVVILAYRLTRNHEEAKDIAQEVFLRAFKHLETGDLKRNVAPWLFRVTRNASFDVLRRRRATARLESVEFDSFAASAEDVALNKIDQSELRRAVTALRDDYRRIIQLHYDDGLLYREVATTLEMPIGTVKTRIARAKKRLRGIIEGCRPKQSHASTCLVRSDEKTALGAKNRELQ